MHHKHSLYQSLLPYVLVTALLEIRNKAEAKRREEELIAEAERDGLPTDNIKVLSCLPLSCFEFQNV